MKELIGKLSRGIIEYNSAILNISEPEIEESIAAETVFKGKFQVFSEDKKSMKGVVYSTNCAVTVLDEQFAGSRSDIRYELNTKYMEDGEDIEGKFIVVSNGGEAVLPYCFHVGTPTVKASIGDINDLFHFTDLVKTDYDEALHLFCKPDFKEVFLRESVEDQALYDGLIKSGNKRQALEEFLVGIHKKSRVNISLSHKGKDYDKLPESYGDTIVISKDGWGYVDIHAEVLGDFITRCKRRITSDDFAGNNYEYRYLIDVDRLHDGMNYGAIVFETVFQKEVFPISVDNIHEHDMGRSEVKRCTHQLMEMYLDFRSGRYTVDVWSERSLALLERARGFDESNDFFKLVQAQICLTKGRDEEADRLLESVADRILDDRENHLEMYCYYLYIRTLQRRDGEMTMEMFRKIKAYYENGYDSWKILWILLYLDDAYENNASLKLARIKEQFKQGCKSPLMYYEAVSVWNRHPMLLRVINQFELQVILFGCKHDMVEEKLAMQVAELAMLEKNFRPLLFRILTSLYEKYKKPEILTAICSVLIRGNVTSSKYFKWYEEGVKREINLTRLYEYYMFSVPGQNMDVLPNRIYMYFVYNGNLLFHRESYLYANIIYNKGKIPNVYKSYKNHMEQFAIASLMKGEMDRNLAVIYREFLQGSMIQDEIAKNLPHILAACEVSVNLPDIARIVVIHKELLTEKTYVVHRNTAVVEQFTDDTVLLMEDLHGNRYCDIENLKVKKLLDNHSLLQLCRDKCNDDIYYVAAATEQFLKYHAASPETVETFRNIMQMEDFRYAYRKTIMRDIIEYYYSHYDGDELDDFLREIDHSELDGPSRNKVVELMIVRGLYDEAYKAMKQYGYAKIHPRRLLKFVSRYISGVSSKEDEFLLNVAAFTFRSGKYNELLLEYLCNYYNGVTKEMLELWKTAKNFEFESRELEERLIAQILFSRTRTGYLVELYESYSQKGSMEMMKKAYFFYQAYSYFVKDKPVNDRYFVQLEKELVAGKTSHDILHEVCKAAYLRHLSEEQSLTAAQKDLAEDTMEKLTEKGYCFEFFKKFRKWFPLPAAIADKSVIEYRTAPDCKVYLHCSTAGENLDNAYITYPMEPVFGGVYVKEFTLFYGESILYYITEETETGTNVTESRNFFIGDDVLCTDSTAYGRLNDILRCKEMKEETTLRELTKNYYIHKNTVEKAFEIL